MFLIEVHQQRRLAEGVEPDVYQLFLVGKGWRIRTPSLAPISDRGYVDAVEKWISVVSLACLGHQFTPILQKQRIGIVRLPDTAILIRRQVGTPRAGIAVPVREGVLVSVWHQPNGQRLAVFSRFAQRQINDFPMELAPFGFDHVPNPSTI